MKKLRIIYALIVSAALFLAISLTACADCGPKPNLRITFRNAGDERYYSTILSKSTFEPGAGELFGDNDHSLRWYNALSPEEQKAVNAFAAYPAQEGFNFFPLIWDSSKNVISWGYMPPDEFVLLVYFPESGKMFESNICHTYAFDSYFAVDLSDVSGDAISVDSGYGLSVQPSYQVGEWILEFISRVLVTIAVELVVALIFGYWEKRTLLFFAIVNVATQILLNIVLSIANINYGILMFLFAYFIGELMVVTFEAVFYGLYIGKYSKRHKSGVRAVFYAICANIASFISGVVFTVNFFAVI